MKRPRLLARLVCAVKGHRRLRVIDGARLIDADQFGVNYQITSEHIECWRCKERL